MQNLPLIIRGSGIVIYGNCVDYFVGGCTVKLSRPTFDVSADFFGTVDVRAQGNPMVDIEYTPVGMLKNFAAHYPYGPSNLVAANSVGNSIFGANPSAVTILTKAGNQISYARAGLYKSPTLFLSPRKTAFGPKTIRAIGRIDVPITNAAALLTAAQGVAFTDTSFTQPVTDIYTAALGNRPAPFNAMGARDGFEIEPVYKMDDAQDDNVGIADTFITDIGWKVRFAPNGLTQEQVQSLANWQGANAILPGQSVAQGNGAGTEDLSIDANIMVVLHAVGIVTTQHGYGVKVDRNGRIEFAQQMTFNAGVPQPLITLPAQ